MSCESCIPIQERKFCASAHEPTIMLCRWDRKPSTRVSSTIDGHNEDLLNPLFRRKRPHRRNAVTTHSKFSPHWILRILPYRYSSRLVTGTVLLVIMSNHERHFATDWFLPYKLKTYSTVLLAYEIRVFKYHTGQILRSLEPTRVRWYP